MYPNNSMSVDELVDKLAKPIYVFRMARSHSHNHSNEAMKRSAETRMNNARREIKAIIDDYVLRTT